MPRYAVTFNVTVMVSAEDEDVAEARACAVVGQMERVKLARDWAVDIDSELMQLDEECEGCEECTRSYGPHYTGRCAH